MHRQSKIAKTGGDIMKFVTPLTATQIEELKALHHDDGSARVRMRAHSILLSHRGYTLTQIADIYEVHRDTVSGWIDRWEEEGFTGLRDAPRSGCPPTLNSAEQDRAIELLKETPRSIKTALAKLNQETGKTISEWTLKRIVKRADMSWKRIRQSLKSKRDADEFEQAEQEIAELQAQHAAGEIDLRYFDEVGFSLIPAVPYAWQPVGETIEIPTARSSWLTVLGFYNTDNEFISFTVKGSVNSDVVIRCIDEFSETIDQKTVVLIDNASTHTSGKFKAKLSEWADQDLHIKYLPTYSPELNLIEILWRFIKYHWMPWSAYESFKALQQALEDILDGIGEKYQVNFA
jgi:transposase